MSQISLDTMAPALNGSAYLNGNEVTISLQDYQGKWLVLFFYGSDFTFV